MLKSGNKLVTAEEILYDVGFAGNPEEANWIINNKKVTIDGEEIYSPKHQRVYFNGMKFPVKVDDELLYYRTY